MEPSEEERKRMFDEGIEHCKSIWKFIDGEEWRKHQDKKFSELNEFLIKCEKSIGILLLDRASIKGELRRLEVKFDKLKHKCKVLKRKNKGLEKEVKEYEDKFPKRDVSDYNSEEIFGGGAQSNFGSSSDDAEQDGNKDDTQDEHTESNSRCARGGFTPADVAKLKQERLKVRKDLDKSLRKLGYVPKAEYEIKDERNRTYGIYDKEVDGIGGGIKEKETEKEKGIGFGMDVETDDGDDDYTSTSRNKPTAPVIERARMGNVRLGGFLRHPPSSESSDPPAAEATDIIRPQETQGGMDIDASCVDVD